jgi:CBS domain-containing protein
MVKDILEKKGPFVASIRRDQTVLDAAREMNARKIGALVVTDADNVVGIVTERDIMTKLVALQLEAAATQIGQIMTCPVACCRPDTSLAECSEVMTTRRIRHLPVVDQGKLAGIVTSGDILARTVLEQQEKISDLERSIEYLHQYIYHYEYA